MSSKENAKYIYSTLLSIFSKSKYTFLNPRCQYFSLPTPLMLYIFYQKESLQTLIKIYQTCKYFFKKCSILPIYYPATCSGELVYTKGLAEHNFNDKVLFWFYDDLTLFGPCQSVRDRIYCCNNIKQLFIRDMKITYDKLQDIISNSTIEELSIEYSKILYSNGSMVPLEIILQNFPHCSSFNFDIKRETCLKGTLEAMNELIFFNKFRWLDISIESINNDFFDAELLWKFVKKNLANDSVCRITTAHLEGPMKKRKFIKELVQTEFNNVFHDWDGKHPKIVIVL